MRSRSSVGLERQPVTLEVAGSNPVGSAIKLNKDVRARSLISSLILIGKGDLDELM